MTKSETEQPTPQQQPVQPASDAPQVTPTSDEAVKKDGTGEHGRPTDDSDPGHS